MTMNSTTILLSALIGLLAQVQPLPVQNSTGVHEAKVRLKRKYTGGLLAKKTLIGLHHSDEFLEFEEMNVMDQILIVNSRLRAPRGLTFREGDIATLYPQSAINCPGNACLWPKSIDGFVYVPYIISPLYDDMDRITVETGMQDIGAGTCIKFVPRTHEANFLDIQPRYGCWSFLGQTGGSQVLSLQTPGCMWSGVATHEFMHALGFVHEQSRSDRDGYVTIVWNNIMPAYIHNFRKQQTNNLNSPYDYNSVMHYGRYAFSEDGGPTIIPKPDPYIPIGQRDGPSALDLHKINVLYNCGANE
uniref:Metalloendopeptidase n=1 Tax=Cynoglossus semilaevis TaxID=244447 RepID=A0A3P8VXY1_CYNSE